MDRACNRGTGGNRQRTGCTCTPSNPVCNHKRLLPGTRSVFKLANGTKINIYTFSFVVECKKKKTTFYIVRRIKVRWPIFSYKIYIVISILKLQRWNL